MGNGIVNLQLCASAEKQEHINYLRQPPAPVSWVADMLEAGTPLYKGVIRSRQVVGSLVTIFAELEGVSCLQRHGTERFLVSQVLPTLRDPRCTDRDALAKVECYMKLDSKGSLEIKVTICERGANRMIVDGNKRAAACYESRSDQHFGTLPIFLVAC